MISSVWRLLLEHIPADEGATAVEYAIMVSLIAVVIIGAVTLVGLQVLGLFQGAVTALEAIIGSW